MTNIMPPINFSIAPGLSRDPRASAPTSKNGDPFAPPGLPAQSDPASASSMRAEEASLRSALAHVFNAYGFFSTDQNDSTGPSQPQPASATTSAADELEDDQPPADLPPAEPPHQHTRGPEALPAQASDRAKAVLAEHAASSPGPIGGADEPTEHSRPVDPHLRAIENRFANEPQLPEAASPSATAKRETHSEQRDKVTFKIAEHSVELIARLSNLSDDEKQRLYDEIESLLAAHGMSLANATVNGEPFSHALRTNP